jgi:hypothetical protein
MSTGKFERMSSEQIQRFLSDRDSALRSLDRQKIEFYCRKYHIQMPKEEPIFWLAVHHARLQIKYFTEEEKAVSRQYLIDRGFEDKIPK